MEIVRILIGLVGIAGLGISVLFILTVNGRSSIPRICRLESGECRSVLAAPQAKIFGIPNYYLGVVFYLMVTAASFTMATDQPDAMFWTLFFATFIAVLTGAYLLFSLIFTLRASCPLCYASHALNFVLMATLIFHVINNL